MKLSLTNFRVLAVGLVLVVALAVVNSARAEATETDITLLGTLHAEHTNSLGTSALPATDLGGRPLSVMNDGVQPDAGTVDFSVGYDTFNFGPGDTDVALGYTFAGTQTFSSVVFQEGMDFGNGGAFLASPVVQVRIGGVWTDIPTSSSPSYNSLNGVNFETYTLTIPPTAGNGIRIHGAPAGGSKFVSVAELRVTNTDAAPVTPSPSSTPTPTPTATSTATSTPTGTATSTATATSTPTATATPSGSADITSSGTVHGERTNGSGTSALPPTDGGGRAFTLIANGDEVSPGQVNFAAGYDTFNGGGDTDVAVGYTFSSNRTFSSIRWVEGMEFPNGGWFANIPAVQVRIGGVWVNIASTISPNYTEANGTSFNVYTLTISPTVGDGIRVHGVPGGSAAFITVAEVRVFETSATPTPTSTATGTATATATATSTGTATATATAAPGADLTLLGSIVAERTNSSGTSALPATDGGGRPLSLINNNVAPAAGSVDFSAAYDTFNGGGDTDVAFGYTYSSTQTFGSIRITEGMEFPNGGWFASAPQVEVRIGSLWSPVTSTISPAYGENNGANFSTYILTIPPVAGDGIRIHGAPGGSAQFVGIAELRVFAPGVSATPTPTATPATTPGTGPFANLQAPLEQSVFGIHPDFLLGGVAFASDGDPIVTPCSDGSAADPRNYLIRFDAQTTIPDPEGAGNLIHPYVELPSRAGCGLVNHPNGSLYSNTFEGVTKLNPDTGALLAGPYSWPAGPGNPYGGLGNQFSLAVHPLTGELLYTALDNTMWWVGPDFSYHRAFSSVLARNPGSGVPDLDGMYFSPNGAELWVAVRNWTHLGGDGTHGIMVLSATTGLQIAWYPASGDPPDGIAWHIPTGRVLFDSTVGTLGAITPGVTTFTTIADGGFRGDLSQVGPDECWYITQNYTRFVGGQAGGYPANSLVRICPAFSQPPGSTPSTNLPPVAVDDNRTTAVDTPINITVMSNDSDPDNHPIAVIGATTPANGSVVVNPDGTITYTPNPGYTGTDTFVYSIHDHNAMTDAALVTITIATAPPDAVDDSATTPVNTPVNIAVLTNDTTPGGTAPIEVIAVGAFSNGGSAAINPDGTVTYTPGPGYTGTATFTYTIKNNTNATDTATVTVTITALPPDAVNDSATTPFNTPVSITVLANDTTPPGTTPLDVTSVGGFSNGGSAVINPDETVTYTPAPGFVGVETFTYTIANSTGATDTATVTVTVAPVAPDAVNDSATTPFNTPVNITVLANDTTPPGTTPLTVTAVGAFSSGGSAVIQPNGTVTYTPAPGFVGVETFTYTIANSTGATDTATVTVTVTSVAPDAVNDSATTPFNTPVSITVLANDTTPPGTTPLDVTSVGGFSNGGSAVINPDETVTYTPAPGFVGTETFTYSIANTSGGTDTATVTVTVTPVAPDAVNDSATTPANTPVNIAVLGNDSTPPGTSPLTVTSVGSFSNGGSAVINPDGTVTYTPALNFVGVETFIYTITNNTTATDTATVTVTVTALQPDAVDDSTTTDYGTPVTIAVLTNDTTPAGSTPLVVTSVGAGSNGGSIVLNPNGTVTYTPAPGFTGVETFPYTIQNSHGGTDTATVSVTVALPIPPNAVDDSATTSVQTPVTIGVLSNDSTPAGTGTIAIISNTPGSNGGTIVVNPDGTATYTPAPTFAGTETFTYTIQNGHGLTDVATVTVTVTAPPPVAVDDTAETPAGTPVTITILTNDSTPPGTGPLTVTSAGPCSSGSIVLNPDGTVTFTPAPGYSGTVTCGYTVTNFFGETDTATITITVTASPPDAINDNASTQFNTPVVVTVLGNDTTAPGSGPIAVTSVTPPGNGAVVVNPDGTVTYTPASGFFGTDTFTYTITNALGLTDTATVTVIVNAAPPVAVDDSASTNAGSPVVITVLGNDTPGTGTLTVSSVGTPSSGTVVINPDGTVTYTPAPGFTGVATFVYTVTNSAGLTDTATVTVTVNALPPDAVDDSASTNVGTPVNITVLSNDSNPGGGTPIVQTVTTPSHGTAVINPNGTVTYTPVAGYVGVDTFNYTIGNGSGLTDTALVTVTINGQAPDAVNDTATTPLNTPVIITVLGNDTTPAGSTPLTVTAVSTPSSGTAIINPSGTVTYTPATGFTGTATFTYTIQNAWGLSDTATVTVTVTAPTQIFVQSNSCMVLEVLPFSAAYTSRILQTLPSPLRDLGVTNHDAGTIVPLGYYTAGTELAFGINVTNTGHTFKMGPASGNPDNIVHATLTFLPSGVVRVGFEDIYGGGDLDFNDVVVEVRAGACPAPNAVNDTATTTVNTPVTITVLANDTTPAGTTPLNVTAVSNPPYGSAVINPGGTVTYTPDTGYYGTDTFTYTVTNSAGQTDTATVTVTIIAPPPDAVNDTATTTSNTPVTISVLANDTTPSGTDPKTVQSVTSPSNGTVQIVNSNTQVMYTPNPGFSGTDTFTYTMRNSLGQTDTATVTVTVQLTRLFISQTGCVELEVLPFSADYTSKILQFLPSPQRDLGVTNQQPGAVVQLGSYTAGTELVFGILVTNTSKTFKMGDASVNPDGLVHAQLTLVSAGKWRVGFEDIYGGGDLDFNDVVVEVRQRSCPPPPTVTNVPGNPNCTTGTNRLKIDPPRTGTFTLSGGGQVVISSLTETTFSWAIAPGSFGEIEAYQIIVKGGPGAAIYTYDPSVQSGTLLQPPTNPSNGRPYGISHITFCFNEQ